MLKYIYISKFMYCHIIILLHYSMYVQKDKIWDKKMIVIIIELISIFRPSKRARLGLLAATNDQCVKMMIMIVMHESTYHVEGE